uniref:Uncharacterized protein n=1 Tax=Pararge aegeria TaxID=116150 RepID=S4P2C3_9NEOP
MMDGTVRFAWRGHNSFSLRDDFYHLIPIPREGTQIRSLVALNYSGPAPTCLYPWGPIRWQIISVLRKMRNRERNHSCYSYP